MGPRDLRQLRVQPRSHVLPLLRTRRLSRRTVVRRRERGQDIHQESTGARKACEQRDTADALCIYPRPGPCSGGQRQIRGWTVAVWQLTRPSLVIRISCTPAGDTCGTASCSIDPSSSSASPFSQPITQGTAVRHQ